MSIRDRVLEHIPQIPALPTAATHVLRLAQNPESGISEIMEALQYDPSLTAAILKLANTAYFAGPRQIATLRDAGVLFGTQQIVELVLASAIFPMTKPPLEGYELPAGALVTQAMAVAITSQKLAAKLNRTAPDHTFTAALLSDIGKIVLGTFLKVDVDPILELVQNEQCSFEQAERQILGIDHAEVGATLLKNWELPDQIVEVVRWHHEPDKFEGDKYVVDLVHVANQLTVSCGLGIGRDGLNYRSSPHALARLGTNPQLLEQVTCDMLAALLEVQKHLPGNTHED